MGEFFRLKDSELEEAHDYARRHISSCFFIMQGFYHKNGDCRTQLDATATYYIYREQGTIKGMVYVNKSKVLFPFFESSKAFTKMDLLKIIKYHQPAMIRGSSQTVGSIYKMIERVMPLYAYKKLKLMTYEKNIISYEDNYITGCEIDFNKAVDFLIGAEQAFSRNPLSINQLKIKIGDPRLKNRYYFIIDGDRLVSQGLVEFSFAKELLIGGIYTHPKKRVKGYGERMSRLLTGMAIKEKKQAYLIVEEKNKPALDLYLKIGYKAVETYEELVLARI